MRIRSCVCAFVCFALCFLAACSPYSAGRPDFDAGVLAQLPCKDVSFERDVTEELWSEREKLFYGATPLYMLRAVKR